MNASNSWTEWSQYVLKELEDLNKNMDAVKNCQIGIKIDIAKVKERIAIRSTIYGAIGALVPVIIALLIMFLKQ